MKPLLIGMAGPAQHGKDTVADILVRRFNFIKMSMSDPIYELCEANFELSAETLKDASRKEEKFIPMEMVSSRNGFGSWLKDRYCKEFGSVPTFHDVQISPRWLTQVAGEYLRRDEPRYLLHKAQETYRELCLYPTTSPIGMVNCSIRYDIEALALLSEGARIIRVYRPDAPQVENHETENPISDNLVSLELYNGHDKRNLEKHVVAYVMQYLTERIHSGE